MKFTPQDKAYYDLLIEKAVELLSPKKIILFGSFARGDFKEKSDIDLAFDFQKNKKEKEWIVFKEWAHENLKTLRNLDLINLSEADASLIESIRKEGRVLYEQ